jgi:uncharacterized membrane protein
MTDNLDPIEPVAGAKEIGALAHLYRGEVYRSTIWRERLDATTNWAVLTTGVALSITFATAESSPLPMVLAGVMTVMFLILEARRYRYFSVWRFRARMLELSVYVPLLRGEGATIPLDRGHALSDDYESPQFRISFVRAIGKRLRRNYCYLFAVQGLAYFGKIAIHPTEIASFSEIVTRAHIGPVPGWLAFASGIAFHVFWITLAVLTLREERQDKSVVADALQSPK